MGAASSSAPSIAVPSIAVIGAGIVGMAAALELRRAGLAVTVLDQGPPGGGASFGNAGLVSVEMCVPMALPGMLRKVPGWLADPEGPLHVRPGYALKAAPWLLRWLRESAMDRVRHNSDALIALHRPALDRYRELLGAAHFEDLIRVSGQVQAWEGDSESKSERIYRALWERQGVRAEALDRDELRQLVPELSDRFTRALFLPRNGFSVNPQRTVQTLAGLLTAEGGAILAERVMKLLPAEGGGWRVVSNLGDRRFDRILVAAGAWSARVLAPLGIRFPLETERGYHATIRAAAGVPRLPVLNRSSGFGVTPMEMGLRVAGTVEIAGLDAPMDERRGEVLARKARAMLPDLQVESQSIWMGFRPSLPDSLPIIGPIKKHPDLFLACGHGHTGVTAAATTGRLLMEQVTGRTPSIDPAPFRFDRF